LGHAERSSTLGRRAEDHQKIFCVDRLAYLDRSLSHLARHGRIYRRLHLHRFYDEQPISLGYRLSSLYNDARHSSGYRRAYVARVCRVSLGTLNVLHLQRLVLNGDLAWLAVKFDCPPDAVPPR
jgi:hypothetical protein